MAILSTPIRFPAVPSISGTSTCTLLTQNLTPPPAAFSFSMSEPHQILSHDYDWSQADLLEACFDPMLPSMGLDGRGSLGGSCDSPAAVLGFGLAPSAPSAYPEFMEALPNAKQIHIRKCCDCGKTFSGWSEWAASYLLNDHSRQTGHLAWACEVLGCKKTFLFDRERDAHQRRPHLPGHGRINSDKPNDCAECGVSTSSNAALIRHAQKYLHQPYGCECGALFSRRDVLNRHLDSLGTDLPQYPCKYCKRHRGADGFKRKDHLQQHIRNYHHLETDLDSFRFIFAVCSHADCPFYRDEVFFTSENAAGNKPFASQAAYTRHMREEHNESPFPCTIRGCNRTGKKGYFREKDLRVHHNKEHPTAPAYKSAKA